MTEFALVTTTVGSADEAAAMAHALVAARLAACVQIVPITSVYRWRDDVETAEERMLVCKIARHDYAEIEREIRTRHSYELPEIVMTPIDGGYLPYLDWLRASTAR